MFYSVLCSKTGSRDNKLTRIPCLPLKTNTCEAILTFCFSEKFMGMIFSLVKEAPLDQINQPTFPILPLAYEIT